MIRRVHATLTERSQRQTARATSLAAPWPVGDWQSADNRDQRGIGHHCAGVQRRVVRRHRSAGAAGGTCCPSSATSCPFSSAPPLGDAVIVAAIDLGTRTQKRGDRRRRCTRGRSMDGVGFEPSVRPGPHGHPDRTIGYGPRTPPKGRTLIGGLARLFGLRFSTENRIQKIIFLYCTTD